MLDFERAHYVNSEERVDGNEAIAFATKDGTVRGRGFTCDLETGLLKLQSGVKFSSENFQITGARGDVRFDPKGASGDRLIKEAVLTDQVAIERVATAKAPFDRAETTFARYSAELKKIFLKTPVTVWNHGQKAVVKGRAEFLEIDLTEKQKPAVLP